jgi:drug/metabolite transporter (DMT)-like permease
VTDARRLYRLGLVLVVFSTVCWSTAGYFTRLIPLDSWTLLFWRGVFGTGTAALFILARERRRFAAAFLGLGRPGLVFSIVSALGMTAYLSALRLASVAHVAIIYASLPFAAAALAALVLRERTPAATLLASAVALTGIAVIVADGAATGELAGDLVAVAMTLTMAVMIVVARRHPAIPMVPAACLSAAMAALIGLPFATVWPITPRELVELALFGATNMGLGLVLFTIGSKYLPASETALISCLEAPLAPFWVWLAFGETPLVATVVGGALVMVAVVANVIMGARRPAAALAD